MRPWLAILTALVIPVTIIAGFWQLDRERQKLDLATSIRDARTQAPRNLNDPREHLPSALWHPVRVEGRFRDADTILLDNRVHQGRAGYHVVTPLEIAEPRMIILVDRGWVAAQGDRTRLPDIPATAGQLLIEGRLSPIPGKTMELARLDPQQRVWMNLDIDRLREARGIDAQPFLIQQTSRTPDALIRDWPEPYLGADKHRAYAMQWFGMAVVAAIFLALTLHRTFRRGRHGANDSSQPDRP